MTRELVLTHLTGERNYTWLHYLDGEKHLTTLTIKRYEAIYPHFFRIHKGVLVDPAFIKAIAPASPPPAKVVVLVNGITLPLSRRRWPEIGEALLAAVKP